MKRLSPENCLLFLFIGILIMLLLIVGVGSRDLELTVKFSVFALSFFTVAVWLQSNLTSVDYNEQWLFVKKKGKCISVPLNNIEWISYINGRDICIYFIGFKSPTIFGKKIAFLGAPYRKFIAHVVKNAKDKGIEIKVIG
jgi:hypothetical protein